MADITAPSKTTSSRDVIVDEITIVGSNGLILQFQSAFSGLNIYEDIFSSVVSGEIFINDGVDAYSRLGIHGNEYITIRFSKPNAKAGEKFERTFRIYKCSDRKPSGNIQQYTLYFCSEEAIFSNQLIVSKAFKGSSFTEYAKSVCKMLKVNKAKMRGINFETSFGDHDVTVTKQKPLDAIQFFAKNAYNDHESTFIFFENNDGFNFRSLESLFNREPLISLKYSTAKLVNDPAESPFALVNEVANFKFDNSFDIMKNTQTSGYSGKLYTLDLINQTYKSKNYSIATIKNQHLMIDDNFPLNSSRNRNDKAMYEEFDTSVNFALTNYDQKNNPYLLSKVYRPQATNIEKTLLQRKMQLQLLENTTLECQVPGHPIYSAGYTVEFDIPAMTPNQQNQRIIDPFHSGKYLITAVRHTLTPKDGLQTFLRLAKNSSASQYDTGNTNEYKKARSL